MIVARTYNKREISDIVCHPAIFATVSDDDIDAGSFAPEVLDECWLSVKNDAGEMVAVYNYHAVNSVTLQLHAHVLPEYRLSCAREASRVALRWLLFYAPKSFMKVLLMIPSVYPKTVNFSKKLGFLEEGISVRSDRVDGVICDRVMMGMTFDQIRSMKT